MSKATKASPRQARTSQSKKEETLQQPIEIFLRLRPLSQTEEKNKEVSITKILNDNIVAVRPPESSLAHKNGDYQEHRFTFSKVLDSNVTQEEFYAETVKKEVKELYENGKNSLITAYGCSGTGKSHTIHGSKREPGIMENIFVDLFAQIDEYKDRIERQDDENGNQDFMVFLSYIEIYNERIYDLLVQPDNSSISSRQRNAANDSRKPLRLRFDKKMKPCVEGLSEIPIRDVTHARETLLAGNLARQSASTAVNHISSRSHALLTVKLVSMPSGLSKKKLINNPEKYLRLRKLTVVDMAGNERSKRTLVSGARMKETSNINSSLMIFRNCIEALKANQQSSRSSVSQHVVPFRESKLTTLLKEYLVGNGKTTMIVCASPSGADYDETINSFKFSSIAKEVRTIQVTQTPPPPTTPKRSTIKTNKQTPQEVKQLRKQLHETQQYAAELESRLRKELTEEFADRLALLQEQYQTYQQTEAKELEEKTKQSQNLEMNIISHMNQLYQHQVKEIFDNPQEYISLDPSDELAAAQELAKQLDEQKELLNQQHQKLIEERDEMKKSFESEKLKLVSLQIRTNNNSIENEQLQEQVVSLENRIEQLQSNSFHDEEEINPKEKEELKRQVDNSKRAQRKMEEKIGLLDEENKVLMDQIRDLQTLLNHKRKELQTLQQTVTQSATPQNVNVSTRGTPTRNTPTRGTPSRFDRVINMLTPKSAKGPSAKAVPTTLMHSDSSGNVQTWQGNANPSLTGDGVSVHFDNIQSTQSMRASRFLHDSSKDEINQPPQPIPGVYSSPSQILMKPTTKSSSNNEPQLQSVTIPFASSAQELSDIEFENQFMNGAAFKKAPQSSKLKKKTKNNNNTENIVNRKRKTSERNSNSFSEVSLDLNPPPKKKSRLNTRKPLKTTQQTSGTRSSKRTKTKTATRTPTTRIR